MAGVIACVFDFDDTLAPDSTTRFLQSRGVDPGDFWAIQVKAMVDRGFDPTLAWLHRLMELIGDDKPLGALTNNDLRVFGETIDATLFPGTTGLLDDLRATVAGFEDTTIEFYVVSGGIRDLLLGSEFVRTQFKAVYACELEEGQGGHLSRIKRCVTFTEKTRYLFEINKGIREDESRTNPYLVNRAVGERSRRVPFANMVYVGDGLTDIPCFSLLTRNGGMAFGVFDPREEGKARRALAEFLRPNRVISMHAPRYGPSDELGSLLRAAVATIATQLELRRRDAYDL